MTKDELKQNFIHGTMSRGSVYCDDRLVDPGLTKLEELKAKVANAKANNVFLISNFQDLDRFNGFICNGRFGEDNLFYDLDIPSYKEENTEKVVDNFSKYLEEAEELLTNLKKDIEATKNSIDVYSNRKNVTAGELGIAADAISLFDDYERLAPNTSGEQNVQTKKVSTLSGGTTARAISYQAPEKVETPKIEKEELKFETETIKTQDTKIEVPKTEKVEIKETPIKQSEKNETQEATKTTSTSNILNDFMSSSNNSTGSSKNYTKTPISTSSLDSVIKEINNEESTSKELASSIKKETKLGTGSLVSSIASKFNTAETIQNNIPEKSIDTSNITETKNAFVPPIAGLAAASTAGLGTKVYMDKSKEKDNEEESDFEKLSENSIVQDRENRSDINPLSKEDLLKVIENNDSFNDDEVI